MGIDDGIVAVHLGADELLHDVSHIRVLFFLVGQKCLQLFVAGKAVGIRSAHAVVRLDHHRVAYLCHKGLAACKVIHHVVAGGGDTGLLIVLLHLALVLDAGHIKGLEAAGDVEIGAQGGISLQPVFIVGLQPVDAAILLSLIHIYFSPAAAPGLPLCTLCSALFRAAAAFASKFSAICL